MESAPRLPVSARPAMARGLWGHPGQPYLGRGPKRHRSSGGQRNEEPEVRPPVLRMRRIRGSQPPRLGSDPGGKHLPGSESGRLLSGPAWRALEAHTPAMHSGQFGHESGRNRGARTGHAPSACTQSSQPGTSLGTH